MSFVDDFMSHYGSHKDYSKTCRFDVFFYLPPGMLNYYQKPDGLRFQCETAELPGYNINTYERRIYGITEAVAATPVYNDINMTFICTGDLWEKRYFDDWMEYILPKGDYGYRAQYRDSYTTNIDVRTYLESSEVSMKVRLVEAFPTSVNPITLNWADDGVNRLSVTFKYKRWEELN